MSGLDTSQSDPVLSEELGENSEEQEQPVPEVESVVLETASHAQDVTGASLQMTDITSPSQPVPESQSFSSQNEENETVTKKRHDIRFNKSLLSEWLALMNLPERTTLKQVILLLVKEEIPVYVSATVSGSRHSHAKISIKLSLFFCFLCLRVPCPTPYPRDDK